MVAPSHLIESCGCPSPVLHKNSGPHFGWYAGQLCDKKGRNLVTLPSLQVSSLVFCFFGNVFLIQRKGRERVGKQTLGSADASQTSFFLFSARYHLFLRVLYFLFCLLGNMVQTRTRWFLSAPGWIIELCHIRS